MSKSSLLFIIIVITSSVTILAAKAISNHKSKHSRPKQAAVYVVTDTGNVRAFRIKPTGLLSPIKSGTEEIGCKVEAVSIGPNRHFAYIGCVNSSLDSTSQPFIFRCVISSNGTLKFPSSGLSDYEGAVVSFSPNGNFAYVNMPQRIMQYRVQPDGKLKPLAASVFFAQGSGPLIIHPSGRFAYTVDNKANVVRQYGIASDGSLRFLSPAIVKTGKTPLAFAITPNGNFSYVVNVSDNTISQYRITSQGTFKPLIPSFIHAGKSTSQLAVHPSGKFAYVTSVADDLILQYRISASGALMPLSTANIHTNTPTAIKINPTGRFAYVANYYKGSVSQYRIQSDGELRPLTPKDVFAGIKPNQIIIASH